MASMKWLNELAQERASKIMDLSDEYWDAILGDMQGAPDDLKANPHSVGKLAVVSTLGLMMYMPEMSDEIASRFASDSDKPTGVRQNVLGRGYMAKVSQGIEASSRTLQTFVGQLEPGSKPNLSKSDTVEDLRQFIPLFEELLTDKIARIKQEDLARAEEMGSEESLLTPQGAV